MAADKLRDAEIKGGLHSFFKLQTTISTTSMVLFDQLGCLKLVLDHLMPAFLVRVIFEYGCCL